jgi:Sister chromatid cohesion protein Dcc1
MPQSDEKGGPEDDAVLCTSNIRSVTLLNSVLLVYFGPQIDGSENQAVIQDSLNELLKIVPAVPKLHRLNVLLKEHEWEEGYEEEDESFRPVSIGDRSTPCPISNVNGVSIPSSTGRCPHRGYIIDNRLSLT